MTNKFRYVAVSSAVVAVLLAGCGSVAGSPAPHGGSGAGGHSGTVTPSGGEDQHRQLPYAGAPKVSKPVDVSEYAEKPCDVVTKRQQQTLSLPEGKAVHDLVSSCRWKFDNTAKSGFELSVNFELTGKGLSLLYEKQKAGEADLSGLQMVNGFPVIRYIDKKSHRRVDCGLVVGVSDKQVVGVDMVSKATESDPCSAPRSLVKAVTATIRKGS